MWEIVKWWKNNVFALVEVKEIENILAYFEIEIIFIVISIRRPSYGRT